MERFLQRTEYAEDRILGSFAHLIDDQFFGEKKDILVNDENVEYRVPLIAAMIGSFLEGSGSSDLAEEKKGRVLVLTEHEESLGALSRLLAEVGIGGAVVGSEEEASRLAERLRSEPVVAMPASIFLSVAEHEYFRPRDFGLVVIEGADLFSERPSEVQRKMWGHLLPPWERRAVLFAAHVGIRTKNTAIDFANNPKTVVLNKAQASLSAISTSMYRVASEHKFRVLLSLIHEQSMRGSATILVFCNLHQTSREVEARLRLNHIHAEKLSVSAPRAKNEDLMRQFSEQQHSERDGSAGGEGEPFVLIVANDSLEALPSEFTPVAIHYDIPLDADVYLERVRIMQPRNAAMLGLVCERYEVGLSAITSRFNVRFEVEEPSQEMLAYPDASEGVPLELGRERPAVAQKPSRGHEGRRSEPSHGGVEPPTNQRLIKDHAVSRRTHSKRGKHGGEALRDHRDREKHQSLYAMNTEERLAYFRNKYRSILKTPAGQPQQQDAPSQAPESSFEGSNAAANGGIVKRFIEKLSPKGKNSGHDGA